MNAQGALRSKRAIQVIRLRLIAANPRVGWWQSSWWAWDRFDCHLEAARAKAPRRPNGRAA